MTHIDVGTVLQSSVNAEFSNLVTRSTGATVRAVIERQLSGLGDGSVAYLDFSRIGVLDRSCADEFVAKLMLPGGAERPARPGFVVLNGISEAHLEAIEGVLHAHGLALVVQFPDGAPQLVGAVTEPERRLWELVMSSGEAAVEAIARAAAIALDDAASLLETLAQRRLLRRVPEGYAPLGAEHA